MHFFQTVPNNKENSELISEEKDRLHKQKNKKMESF